MGKNGSRQVLVNSRGKEVGTLSDVQAVPGKQLKLTIDLDLQIAAEEAMEGKPGAIVAMNPHDRRDPGDGQPIPHLIPTNLRYTSRRDEWNQLITDPGKPLLNKAIQAQLAPGSVFKIIMSTAGLQEGIAQKLVVNCGGGKTFYGRFFKCWIASTHGSHGSVNISKAIYHPAIRTSTRWREKLGIGKIAKYATDAWPRPENRHRFTAGSFRRDAVGRVEDQELQAEVVCRRNHLGRHWTRCGRDHADSIGARHWRNHQRRTCWSIRMSPSRTSSRRDFKQVSTYNDKTEIPDRTRTPGTTITDAMANVVPQSARLRRRTFILKVPTLPARPARADHLAGQLESKMGAKRQDEVQRQLLVRRHDAASQSGNRRSMSCSKAAGGVGVPRRWRLM